MPRRTKISVEEASKRFPGTKLIRIADSWLEAAAKAPKSSVYSQLLDHLKKDHGCEEPRRDLHNRAFMGKDLAKRLEKAETKRVRRFNKGLTADKVKSYVGWANVGSGPLESFQSHPVTGDGILVTPDRIPDYDD